MSAHLHRQPAVALSALALALALGLGLAPAAHAATFLVNTTADAVDVAPGDGTCAAAGAVCTLRAAIQEANAFPGNDTITLPLGNYLLLLGVGDDLNVLGDFDITSNITINGAGTASSFVDGNNADRVFDIHPGAVVVMSGLTIRGANSGNKGGGARNRGALTLSNCVVTGNTATEGGGIYVEDAGSTLTISDCVVSLNTATGDGGGIRSGSDTVTVLTDVTLDTNSASSTGGGANFEPGDATLTGVLFKGNTASDGAGLFTKGGASDVGLTNVTFSGNNASSEGGGIWAEGGTLTLDNVTLGGNTAGTKGGGIRPKAGTVTARNTILSGNTPDQCERSITDAGNNLDGGTICGFSGGESNINPLLGPLQDNGGPTLTRALLTGSPAIDAGTTLTVATDQRGVARPQDGDGNGSAIWDIGAYEATLALQGTIFEDVNYGGGIGRSQAGSGGVGVAGAHVQLYDAAGNYLTFTTSGAGGSYGFSGLAAGNYTVRVVNSTVQSSRAGWVSGVIPVQTFRTDASSGAAVAVTDRVGGEVPGKVDAGPSATTLAALSGPSIAAQSITPVTLGGTPISGIDFGYNFNTIVNVNAAGQGSLYQFLTNSNALSNAGLAIVGQTAGEDVSIFMISDGLAHPGLRAGLANLLNGAGVAVISAGIALPPISGVDTTVDGTTQTANVGNTNGAVLGAGGTVGVDAVALGTVAGPEVEIRDGASLAIGLHVQANDATIRGVAIHGFGTMNGEGGIVVNDTYSGTLIEDNLLGTTADAFVDPGASERSVQGIHALGGDGGTIRDNLIGFNAVRGIFLELGSDGWTVSGNEIRDHGLSAEDGDGIAVSGSHNNVINGNLITGSSSQGYIPNSGATNNTFVNNTLTGNGVGSTTTVIQSAAVTVRGSAGTGNLLDRNLIYANYGAGVQVNSPALGTRIRRNAIYDNGTIVARNGSPATGQIGIDLNAAGDDVNLGTAPFRTLNDSGDGDTGGNGLLNFPILSTATISGGNLTLTGFARPGSVIELFTTAADPSGFGEGLAYKLTLTEGGTGSGGDDPYADTNASSGAYSGVINGINQGADTTNRFSFTFPVPAGIAGGTALTSTATLGGQTSEFSGNVTATVLQVDMAIAVSDNPDPAPLAGPLVYTLLVTNNGPGSATGVTVTDTLPASVTLQSATPSQGSCSGTTTITCNLGAMVPTGTASVEILVTTTTTGMITNNVAVSANEPDPVSGNDTDSEDTNVTADSSVLDVPLTQLRRVHGFVDYTVTGNTLRTQPNGGGTQSCTVGASSSASISGIPGTATISVAYLYWAGSGSTVDANVTLDGGAIVADRTFEGQFSLGATTYEYFGGHEDVTAQVTAKRNASYTFAGLTVDTGSPYCDARAVLAGWSLVVIYEDAGLTGKTLVLYDGFDIERNGATSYLLTGIYSADPPEAKTTFLLWEGDPDLAGTDEFLEFNGTQQSDGLNPINNVFNSTINSLPSTTTYGVDLDTFDVSAEVTAGDTLATTRVSAGPDLVILNAVVLQAKSNLIAGFVFEDVNYGGGAGRARSAAATDAPSFAVNRPGVTVELYDAAGNFLRTTTTGASGSYGFTGLVDGTYRVRVVNDSITSSRPGATGAELPVQTFLTDASSGVALPVTDQVGGAVPSDQDAPANVGMANLGSFTAQSVTTVLITTGIAVPDVNFGFNFDTIVNSNDSGQGSLRQFIANANALTNASLDQDGLTAGVENSIFMIPSDADPLGRAQDPNFDVGRGVATITLASRLPAIGDADTALDATLQTTLVGDTNAGTAGNPELGGTAVGTGPDGIEGTGDEFALPGYLQPEVEIDGGDQGTILEIAAGNALVRGLALFNAPSPSMGILVSGGTGCSIVGNFVGPDADGADPTAGRRLDQGLALSGGDCDVTDNFVAYTEETGIVVENASVVSGNEVFQTALGNGAGDGISVEGSTGQAITVRRNRVDKSAGYGLDSWEAPGPFTVEDNTFSRGGQGAGVENGGARLFGTGSTLRNNVITGNAGAGVTVVQRSSPGSALDNRITQNAIYANGGLGLDLDVTNTGAVNPNGDGVTANDGALDGTLPNRGMDYPVISTARISGSTLAVDGYVGTAGSKVAGTHTLEFFKAADDGNNSGEVESGDGRSVAHGEGRWFIDTCTTAADGSFSCNLTVPAAVTLATGDTVTATATNAVNSTSEFAANAVGVMPALVKRAFQLDGTPIASGSALPTGMPVRFLIYVNNPGGTILDVGIQDVLDPLFAYTTGSIRVDNSYTCAATPCNAADEDAILAAVVAATADCHGSGSACTDAADGDIVRYDPAAVPNPTLSAGGAGNAQLDLAPNKAWAIAFTVQIQ